ncbi:MAG TPA: tetratricopeptide repeat protein [Longimicrobiales bacterium]|nr:tetratricopeptide repeat protein [Longimicrobiales bacterium]
MDAPRRWPFSLISELQRRQVIRVAVVYLLATWIMSQVAETMFPNLGLPAWSVTLVMALLLIGFPVAVALAWAFDITPHGVERTHDRPAEVRDSAEPRPIRTIVALPFANLSSNGDTQYISDGMTEELMGALARIPGLRVAARTSSFAFSNRGIDIREIGRQLGVDAAVEGSVRIVDTRVRIAVQLTDVQDGYQIWSQTFDRPLGDILALQEDIARSIVAVLRPGSVIAAGALVRPNTANAEAWSLYLQGRFFWNRRTPAGLRTAIERLRAATASDPQFALAHAGLADCYSIMLDHGAADPNQTLPLALAAARKAVTLDDGLAEAHASLGLAAQVALDWTTAEAAFLRAVELDASCIVAHQRYALLLAWRGRDEEALRSALRAREQDPLSLIVNTTIGWVHYYGRRPERATAEYRSVLTLEPSFASARLALGLALLQLDRPDEAVHELETAAELSERSSGTLAPLAIALRAAGKRGGAENILAELVARRVHTYVSPWFMAVAALAGAEPAAARDWLRRAAAERSPQLAYANVEPLLDEIRGDAALRDILATVSGVDRLA